MSGYSPPQPQGRFGGGDRHISIGMPDLRRSVTLWIIGLCVGVYITQALLNQLGLVSFEMSYSVLGLSRAGLSRGWLWQLVTTPFIHFNVSHLTFNMLALAFLGVDIERRLGRVRYVVFSCLCALAGAVGFLVLSGPTSLCREQVSV